jgi:ribosomal protein L40E
MPNVAYDEFEEDDEDPERDEGPSEADRRRFGDAHDHDGDDDHDKRSTCEECGAELYFDADMCHACGAFQLRESRTEKTHVLARIVGHPMILIIVALVIIAVAFLL